MRIDPLNHFAVEFQHEAQHTVRGWMLRSEIDREIAQRCLGHQLPAFPPAAFSSPGSG